MIDLLLKIAAVLIGGLGGLAVVGGLTESDRDALTSGFVLLVLGLVIYKIALL